MYIYRIKVSLHLFIYLVRLKSPALAFLFVFGGKCNFRRPPYTCTNFGADISPYNNLLFILQMTKREKKFLAIYRKKNSFYSSFSSEYSQMGREPERRLAQNRHNLNSCNTRFSSIIKSDDDGNNGEYSCDP